MKFLETRFCLAAAVLSFAALAVTYLPADEDTPTTNTNNALTVGKLRVGKVLFLGNSITLHGPSEKIGWSGDWGMAASARDKDYVHQLLAKISTAAGGTPRIMVRNIADFERKLTDFNIRENLKEELAFQADVVIIAIGENASSPKTDEARIQFATALRNLLSELNHQGHPTLLIRSQFWHESEKDQLLKKACDDAGAIFVDNSHLGRDQGNYARAERKIEHEGVAAHPGDKGMAAIAEELWKAMKKAADSTK